MFNNVVLDVFIGLIFIYLLYSLLATVIQEILAQWFALRSRLLVRAIRRMLEDEMNTRDNYWKNSTLRGFLDAMVTLFSRFFYPIRRDENLIKTFYDHPTIKYLGENRLFKKPAYLNANNFSQTIIQLLRGDEYDGRMESESTLISRALETNSLRAKPETLRHLRLLFADSKRDSTLFKVKLENWFEETMQRCSGWYKKQTQLILIIVGFCLAVAFNVDTIAISKILVKDKGAREQLVQLAISRQKDYGDISDSLSKTGTTRKEVIAAVDSNKTTTTTTVVSGPPDSFLSSTYKKLEEDAATVQGILGLKALPAKHDSSMCMSINKLLDSIAAKSTGEEKKVWQKIKEQSFASCSGALGKKSHPLQDPGLKWIGWLITALAISLGSGFWFDMLNKFIKLRGAGTKPPADTANPGGNASVKGKDENGKDIKG